MAGGLSFELQVHQRVALLDGLRTVRTGQSKGVKQKIFFRLLILLGVSTGYKYLPLISCFLLLCCGETTRPQNRHLFGVGGRCAEKALRALTSSRSPLCSLTEVNDSKPRSLQQVLRRNAY